MELLAKGAKNRHNARWVSGSTSGLLLVYFWPASGLLLACFWSILDERSRLSFDPFDPKSRVDVVVVFAFGAGRTTIPSLLTLPAHLSSVSTPTPTQH